MQTITAAVTNTKRVMRSENGICMVVGGLVLRTRPRGQPAGSGTGVSINSYIRGKQARKSEKLLKVSSKAFRRRGFVARPTSAREEVVCKQFLLNPQAGAEYACASHYAVIELANGDRFHKVNMY